MKENRSVLDLLRADYTFLNERLAKHYGIPNVYGSHFRRVELGPDHVRGGLLGQGSIMTVTSYANRTSPVRRGKWILENLLGTPVPPPPLNVPPLPENNPGAKVLTVRERMVQHRANAVCASCHQLMDPVGLATENFDAIGRYRTQSEAGGPDRRVGRAARRQHVRRRHRAAQGRAEPSRAVRDDAHGKADDLCARPRARVLRCAGRARYHAARAGR